MGSWVMGKTVGGPIGMEGPPGCVRALYKGIGTISTHYKKVYLGLIIKGTRPKGTPIFPMFGISWEEGKKENVEDFSRQEVKDEGTVWFLPHAFLSVKYDTGLDLHLNRCFCSSNLLLSCCHQFTL